LRLIAFDDARRIFDRFCTLEEEIASGADGRR
jgi:hypothetical protein